MAGARKAAKTVLATLSAGHDDRCGILIKAAAPMKATAVIAGADGDGVAALLVDAAAGSVGLDLAHAKAAVDDGVARRASERTARRTATQDNSTASVVGAGRDGARGVLPAVLIEAGGHRGRCDEFNGGDDVEAAGAGQHLARCDRHRIVVLALRNASGLLQIHVCGRHKRRRVDVEQHAARRRRERDGQRHAAWLGQTPPPISGTLSAHTVDAWPGVIATATVAGTFTTDGQGTAIDAVPTPQTTINDAGLGEVSPLNNGVRVVETWPACLEAEAVKTLSTKRAVAVALTGGARKQSPGCDFTFTFTFAFTFTFTYQRRRLATRTHRQQQHTHTTHSGVVNPGERPETAFLDDRTNVHCATSGQTPVSGQVVMSSSVMGSMHHSKRKQGWPGETTQPSRSSQRSLQTLRWGRQGLPS